MSSLSKNIGYKGEQIAVDYLSQNGYIILNRNYHSKFGEIDIIASKDEYIIFIEVKTRNVNAWDSPKSAVSKSKQIKIIKTAMTYLAEHNVDSYVRFDVIEIINIGNISTINHIDSAFILEDEYGLF